MSLSINIELQLRDDLAERLVSLASERGQRPVDWLAKEVEDLIARDRRPRLLDIENFHIAAAVAGGV